MEKILAVVDPISNTGEEYERAVSGCGGVAIPYRSMGYHHHHERIWDFDEGFLVEDALCDELLDEEPLGKDAFDGGL